MTASSIIKDYREQWRKFLEGDKAAFSLLYESFSDSLFDYGLRFVKDEHLVKDCIQDLFVKLYENKANLSETNNPQAYLFRAMKGTIINALSKRHRTIYVVNEELPFYVTYSMNDNTDTSEDDVQIDDDTKAKFVSLIKALSPRQREAIYLRYQHGMDYDSISQILDVEYQSARNLIHRALTKIRSELDIKVFLILFLNQL